MIMDGSYRPPGLTAPGPLKCLGCGVRAPQLGIPSSSLNGTMSRGATILGALAFGAVVLTIMSYSNGKGRR